MRVADAAPSALALSNIAGVVGAPLATVKTACVVAYDRALSYNGLWMNTFQSRRQLRF